jgi:hypothetical protein
MGFMRGSTGLCTPFLTDARELTGGRTTGLVHKPSRAPRPLRGTDVSETWRQNRRIHAMAPL